MKAIHTCIDKIFIISGPVYGLICPHYGSNEITKYKNTKVWVSFLGSLAFFEKFCTGYGSEFRVIRHTYRPNKQLSCLSPSPIAGGGAGLHTFFIRNSFIRNLYWGCQIAKKLSVLKSKVNP